ncbi:unnamed protein product [Clonostachys byssicola]|uniref:Heterokaryon incompatibility domain-containing protein n=1 Tax=Clonostachys byssicola TaxID=160290 RepID=A0A9N9Y447_9HYPO|nr:unnamed protein product [Clonostachys byssicola]
MNAKLCDKCFVIPFNDQLLEPHVVKEVVGQDGEFSTLSLSPSAYQKILLDYHVIDTLPELPLLNESANLGCSFCSLLRHEILRAGFDYHGPLDIRLAYSWGDDRFPKLGLGVLVAELNWRPDIPSIPPASALPDILRDCIIFALETNDTSVASWLRIPRLRKADVLCEENVQFMKEAINKCTSECSHRETTDFLPTRLLYLGSDLDSHTIRLRSRQDTAEGSCDGESRLKYAALSYCWGSQSDGENQLCTTSDSLEARMAGINENSMHPVLRDAVKVCRALSIDYLWVDSMCIIQDDLPDWESESESMAFIYSHALITICALSSNSGFESFLTRDRRHIPISFSSQINPSIVGQYSLVASGTCRDKVLFGWPALDVDHFRWDSRGWTLQESLMSPRKLFFGESMIHFQCDHIYASETGYYQSYFDKYGEFNSESEHYLVRTNEWDLLLSDYGTRKYTNVRDMLPGLSGMAKYVSKIRSARYLAGLWESDLPYSLMWFPWCRKNTENHIFLDELVDRLCCPNPYIAPSWSCIRPLGGVRIEFGLRFVRPGFWRELLTAEACITETRITPKGENIFGEIQDGVMRIRGRVANVPADIIPLYCHQIYARLWHIQVQGRIIAYCNIDCVPKEEVVSGSELLMLMLMSSKGSPSWEAMIQQWNRYDDGEGSAPSSELEDSDEGENGSHEVENESNEGETDSEGGVLPPSFSRGSRKGSPTSHGRNVYGLLLHPARESGRFVRVGVWASVAGDGVGMSYFEQFDHREVEII